MSQNIVEKQEQEKKTRSDKTDMWVVQWFQLNQDSDEAFDNLNQNQLI